MSQVQFKKISAQKNWISGTYQDSNSGKTFSVISPYFGKEIATVPDSNYSDLDNAVLYIKKFNIEKKIIKIWYYSKNNLFYLIKL